MWKEFSLSLIHISARIRDFVNHFSIEVCGDVGVLGLEEISAFGNGDGLRGGANFEVNVVLGGLAEFDDDGGRR